MLDVRELSFRYGRQLVVDAVTFGAQAGERLLILGANGAGKSSLLRALAETPSAARFAGRAICGQLGRPGGVGYLLQAGNVAATLTVRENLLLAGWYLESEQRTRRCSDLLARLPLLSGHADTAAAFLSGGERQALALAMAAMPGPRLLLLDEPAAGLFPAASRQLFALLPEICREVEIVVMVEHRLDLALASSSRVLAMAAGRLIWEFPASDLTPHSAQIHTLYLGS